MSNISTILEMFAAAYREKSCKIQVKNYKFRVLWTNLT